MQASKNILTVDIEATKLPFSFPWQSTSRLCSIGIAFNDEDVKTFVFEHVSEPIKPHADSLKEIQEYINKADLIVAHNAKFDANWLKHAGLDLTGKKLWCTLVVDYLINGQYRLKYDLNSVARRYDFGTKQDAMAQYWEDGFETDEIPLEIHIPYLTQDVNLTRQIYKKQESIVLVNGLSKLVELTCEVTDILSDMELLGVKFDKDAAIKYHKEFSESLRGIDTKVYTEFGEEFNLASSRQLSAHLYGGSYPTDGTETYTVTLKDGRVKERTRKIRISKCVAGAGFTPLDGTESDATPGVYSTGIKVLKLLRADTEVQKKILELLKERSKIEKIIEMLCSKNEDGGLIPAVCAGNTIHPQFNQTVTVTGRLSSKQPKSIGLHKVREFRETLR